ncbi:fatty-acid amide hydrolase 2 [Neodiprion lecontei]|uniref:Fatty-acid amide hydrolase 2 n=1 Tax=Neodiprion lecontei TaxID=441921 RepID=A0A6J0CB23_NEOLC|nr:fatty-acid amide hydrolase 2 [Neodiprion lecontei]
MCKAQDNKADNPHQKQQLSLGKALKQLALELLWIFITQIHSLFDLVVDFCFKLYYQNKIRKVGPIKNKLLLESAVDLAEKIRNKKVTAEEVVQSFIERCKEVQEILNVIVEDRYEQAIAEAKEVDKLINKHPDPASFKITKPFLGIPFTTKESNEAKGFLHTMGSMFRRDYRSPEDATVIGYLKSAGGIIIAKTNIPELNMWTESRNNLYGQTNNPYDTTRTVGGSSGGEGAIIASCGAPISIASDIGGSIRMPAFFNGVFGHKPSEGLTPMKGVGLRENEYDISMVEAGPICKKAVDLDPLLRVLIGDNISKLKLDQPVDLKTLQIFYQEESGDIRCSKVSGSLRKAMKNAVDHFKGITGAATKVKLPGTEYSYRLWRYWMTKEVGEFNQNITNKQYRTTAKAELVNLLTFRSQLTLAAIIKLIDNDYLPKENSEWAEKTTENLKVELLNKLGDNGVLFYPSSPLTAGYHYSAYFKPFNFGYWCIFNVLKFPACQVPLGLDKNGLPVGIQVVAAPYQDHLCLAVARELESAFGGWVNPS